MFASAHAAISAARGLRRFLKKGAREGRRAASRPRSGPVEGVWGNREVPPARTCESLTGASRRRATSRQDLLGHLFEGERDLVEILLLAERGDVHVNRPFHEIQSPRAVWGVGAGGFQC